jgi:tetratricopeptide (TPR) repeat protein
MAFLLGATAFAPRKGMVSQPVSIACFAGIMLDMMTNWFVNPGIFGAVTVLSPVFFGAGALAGIKIETRKKTKAEQHQVALEERARRTESRNPMAELRAKNRALIEAGFSSAKGGQLELAQRQLSQAMTQLLQEHPVDGTAVKALAERMTNPTLYIEVSSNQWLEWGETAKAKNSPEAAILFLKKGLSCEKNANFARRALYVLGETCVMSKIEVEDGLKRLKKVIEMNPNDILAKQCQRILDVYGRKDSTST